MKYIVSVSKKRHSKWKIYGYDLNEEEELFFTSKNINPLLVPFYKMQKRHRTKLRCLECNRIFIWIHRWYEKNNDACPYC